MCVRKCLGSVSEVSRGRRASAWRRSVSDVSRNREVSRKCLASVSEKCVGSVSEVSRLDELLLCDGLLGRRLGGRLLGRRRLLHGRLRRRQWRAGGRAGGGGVEVRTGVEVRRRRQLWWRRRDGFCKGGLRVALAAAVAAPSSAAEPSWRAPWRPSWAEPSSWQPYLPAGQGGRHAGRGFNRGESGGGGCRW